jgi:hypothetical protein
MRCIRILLGICALLSLTRATAAAQTITLSDPDAARAAVRVGYGGRGPDLDVSIDSPRIAGLFRFRGDIGHGHWLGINGNRDEPRVTRVAASALLFVAPRHAPDLPWFIGIGIGAFVPHGSEFRTRRGARLIIGMEGVFDRWAIGPEVEADLTNGALDRTVRKDLLPTFRVGIAVRRQF